MIAANLEQARSNMVFQQIRTWEVVDQRVIDLLEQFPRDHFVPEQCKNLAYSDIEIPLGDGQRMMAPKIEAKLLQALNIQPTDKILEIGTGSGFLTACLAKLGEKVISLEINENFIPPAQEKLTEAAINNVEIRHADGLNAAAEGRPFDIIAVTGSIPKMSSSLKEQLVVGGKMFIVTGELPAMEANLVTRVSDTDWRTESLFETELSPLSNIPQESSFNF